MIPSDPVVLAAWIVGWVLLWRVPRLPRQASPPSEIGRPITVVIPARNEAATLPLLLGDLERSRPEGARVIVVDDASTDGTGDVARAFDFVEVVEAPALREGWIGKTWACHQGALRAKDGTLVFLDADVRLEPGSLDRAVARQQERGGLLTVWPWHAVERPYEHLSALFNVVTFMSVGSGSLLPPRRPRAAFGPLMVTSVDDYRRTGGHEAVQHSVIDDFALAGRYADADLPVTNLGGGRDVRFRMYPNGLRALFDGWTKNYAAGAFAPAFLRVFLVGFWLTCGIGAITWHHGIPRPKSIVLTGLYVVQMAVMMRQVGRFGILDALLYPFYTLVLLGVLFRSAWRTFVLGSVTWRGRAVPVGRAARAGKNAPAPRRAMEPGPGEASEGGSASEAPRP